MSRYRIANEFKAGQMVRIKDDISITLRRHSEDSEGKMRTMVGRTFKVKRVGDGRVYIGDFMWAPEDLIDLSEDFEALPLPKTDFLFDPKEII